jgi:hypothetical protein
MILGAIPNHSSKVCATAARARRADKTSRKLFGDKLGDAAAGVVNARGCRDPRDGKSANPKPPLSQEGTLNA